ncbi:MAG: S8 family serine peptidase [Actinomycetota bacterium]|nr:S8 family serine peptidase [Actinomycetota bacterium]
MKRTGTGFLLDRQSHVRPSGLLAWRVLGVVGVLLVAVVVSWGRATPSDAGACRHPAGQYEGGAAGKGRDPLFEQQWGLRRINAPAAWKQGATGKGAVIAVLDGGVDLSHPDLRKKLVKGMDFAVTPGCDGPQDEDGHGTHVAGIAAANTNNGIGIAGVAPDAKIMPVRVLGLEDAAQNNGAVTEAVSKGIRYAADHGAEVINMSFTIFPLVENPTSAQAVSDAIKHAWKKGVVLVAAAGNDFVLPCEYPASDPMVLCVGAVDRDGMHSWYGSPLVKSEPRLTLSAPGGSLAANFDCASDEGVWSTVLPGPEYSCGTSGYISWVGTSMASPHVAGVAALLAAEGLSNEEIVECLTATALNPHTGQRGQFDPVYGYGEVDAAAAVEQCS